MMVEEISFRNHDRRLLHMPTQQSHCKFVGQLELTIYLIYGYYICYRVCRDVRGPFLLTGSSAGASGRRRCTETVDADVALAKMHEDGSAPGDVVGGTETWAHSTSTCQKLHVQTRAQPAGTIVIDCNSNVRLNVLRSLERPGPVSKTHIRLHGWGEWQCKGRCVIILNHADPKNS